MPHLPFHQQQLEFMIQLAQGRHEFLDPIFRFLNYFDTPYFFMLLIPLIWLGYSYQWGIRIFYWITFNNLTNSAAKSLIGWPRPSTDIPELGLIHPSSHGFPSGGAQTCMFLGCLLIYYWRSRAAWVVGIFYILLISFSRLYLGIHYPLDIIGGWIAGLSLLYLFLIVKHPLEKWLEKQGLFFCLILTLVIPGAIILLFPTRGIYYTMGAAMGVGIGIYFSLLNRLFLPKPKNWNEGMSRSLIGISMLFLFIFLWPAKEVFSQSFAAGLFMSLAASPICKRFS